jgi:hypothetical protein
VQFSLSLLLKMMLAVSLLVVAGRRFPDVVVQLHGLVAGGLLLIIGAIVGGICGTQRGTRALVIVVSSLYFVGLANGLIQGPGNSLLNWTYLCACVGLTFGALYRVGLFPSHDPELRE